MRSIIVLALLAPALVLAQPLRPSRGLYVGVRGNSTAYSGELDRTDGLNQSWLYGDLGADMGFEAGYIYSPALTVGTSLRFGTHPAFDRPYSPEADMPSAPMATNGTFAVLQGVLRYFPLPDLRFAPYAHLGGVLTYKSGRVGDGAAVGYGPAAGAGLDVPANERLSFFIEGSGALVFPDAALDGVDPDHQYPGGAAATSDRSPYDLLASYTVGARFLVGTPPAPPSVALQCPAALHVNEPGPFRGPEYPSSTPTWSWGDGTSARGSAAEHTYTAPGTYTARFAAGRRVAATCEVVVHAGPPPPAIEACTASSLRSITGQPISFDGRVSARGSAPRWTFGDGTAARTLAASHTYEEAGTYEATLTVQTPRGPEECRVTVVMVSEDEVFCAGVRTLETIHFGFEMDALSITAKESIERNAATLRRCPEMCVRVEAYADHEEGDPAALSRYRADEVRATYTREGVPAARIHPEGMGRAPDAGRTSANGPGDRNARRATSTPMACSQMEPPAGD